MEEYVEWIIFFSKESVKAPDKRGAVSSLPIAEQSSGRKKEQKREDDPVMGKQGKGLHFL